MLALMPKTFVTKRGVDWQQIRFHALIELRAEEFKVGYDTLIREPLSSANC